MSHSPLPSLKSIIQKYDLTARKSLGQNFILDSNITDKIVQESGDLKGLNIVEIGAGPGGLTRSLLKSEALTVYVVEKDPRCVSALQELKSIYGERLVILAEDATRLCLPDIIPAPRAIIANLPYNIGTHLLLGWLEEIAQGSSAYRYMTLMFQKEVAQRLYAECNTSQYGRISVITQWLCQAYDCFDLPPSAFSPPPKVTSTVVKLTPLVTPLYEADKTALEKTLAAAFGNRRKMLRSALKTATPETEAWLERAQIAGERRAETLSVREFCQLARALALLEKR